MDYEEYVTQILSNLRKTLEVEDLTKELVGVCHIILTFDMCWRTLIRTGVIEDFYKKNYSVDQATKCLVDDIKEEFTKFFLVEE